MLCMFSGFKNPGFISKHPGSPVFPSVDDPLKCLVVCEEWVLFFCLISLRFGLSNDCLSGSSAASGPETISSGSMCSQSEYFLLWGSQKAFTSWYLKRLTFDGGGDLMEFTKKCEALETFPYHCSVFLEPWKCLAFAHPLARSSAVGRTTSVCLFELYKGYGSFSKDLHHFLKKKKKWGCKGNE